MKRKFLRVFIAAIIMAFASFGCKKDENLPAIPSIPTEGLIIYFPFNGNTNDESGNGNNATFTGTVLVTGRKGQSNHACKFNGTDAFAALPATLLSGKANFTFSCWIKTQESESNGVYWNRPCIFGNATYGEPSGDFGLNTNGGVVGMWSGLNATDDNFLLSDRKINDNNWHHILCSYDQGDAKIRLYVDGSKISTELDASRNLSGAAFFLMAENYYRPLYFHEGILDDVRFYNRAITVAEIQELYKE